MSEEKKEVAAKEVELVVEEVKQDPDFVDALKSAQDKLKDKEINVANIMSIVQITMEAVELTKVKGEKQKDLAVKLIKKIIEDAPISDDKEKFLLDMLKEGVISSTIDLVVAASKGEIDINSVKEVAVGCCGFLIKKIKK
tara:strand:- start:1593 stop:2012 length:420 start_codon:yes stop_codon:yes gene_type:complete